VPQARPAGKNQPHVMLIYPNDAERSRLVQPYLRACERGYGFLSILSGAPGKERRKLTSSAKVLVMDARALKSDSNPVRTFAELADGARQRFTSGGFDDWLWIGDWEHLLYGRMDSVLKIERYVAEHLDCSVVCCFRSKGFSSLSLREIGELFDIHDAIILPASTFAK